VDERTERGPLTDRATPPSSQFSGASGSTAYSIASSRPQQNAVIYRSLADAGINTGRGVAVEKDESQKLGIGLGGVLSASKAATSEPRG
jgi:hypothetical protein